LGIQKKVYARSVATCQKSIYNSGAWFAPD
jgi:hypothetical protein